MTAEIATAQLLGFLLAMVRAAAWLFIAPPFAGRAVPALVKAALAMAMAFPVAGKLAPTAPDLTMPGLLNAIVMQVLAGAALGFVTMLIFAAVQAAGDLIDLFGGFTLASAFDPLSMQQSSVFGRFNSVFAVVVLFMIDGHLMLMRGFYASYDALPLTGTLELNNLARVLTVGLGQFFVAALQIAAPLIAVLFLTDAALGLLTKISPALNAFSLGYPAKILFTVLLVGSLLPLVPEFVDSLVTMALRAMAALVGG